MEIYRPSINFMTAQNYVDFLDHENPFKQQLQIFFFDSIIFEQSKYTKAAVYLAKNKLEIADDFFDPLGKT